MKRNLAIAFFFFGFLACVLMMSGVPAMGQEDLGRVLLGKWRLEPNRRSTEGSVVFSSNGSYVLTERHPDGVRVETKGEYRLCGQSSPVRIDLCPSKCGGPGSKWTTRFGIMRILSENKVEIRTSPDANYPPGFSEDKTEEYTMILIR